VYCDLKKLGDYKQVTMPHTRRDSYKTKWLEALNSSPNEHKNKLAELENSSDQASAIKSNVTLTLTKVHGTMMQAAHSAQILIQTLDEQRFCKDVEFASIASEIDDNLFQLDLNTMARRFRDLYKIATERISLLDAALQIEIDTVNKYERQFQKQESSQHVLQRAAIESLYIGLKPTDNELEDYGSDGFGTENTRFKTKYLDLSDDFSIVKSVSDKTAARTKSPLDDNEDSPTTTLTTRKKDSRRKHQDKNIDFS
jgi:hypothetical protein